jgi:hypothetical protein
MEGRELNLENEALLRRILKFQVQVVREEVTGSIVLTGQCNDVHFDLLDELAVLIAEEMRRNNDSDDS